MTTKKVAVLLATYNGEKYIAEFLESLLAQSFTEFELFVRDDGSTDNTLNILTDYSDRLNITLIDSSSRLGAAKSFIQLLIEVGEGFNCYMFADQDDVWNFDKIERAYTKLLNEKNDVPILYCAGLELVDSSLAHISFSLPPRIISLRNALIENIATGCTIALNEKARELVINNLPEKLIMHDWWFYIVFSALGQVIYDAYPALKYRQHGGNVIGAATSPFQDLKRRIKRFLSSKKDGVFSIADQAAEFDRCFGPFLTADDARLVKSIIEGKKTMSGRFRLALNSGFVRQKKMDTFILRILFLLGRF